MEYNTQKKPLVIPEYGRNVHTLIDHLKTIQDEDEKLKFADAIIDVMANINPNSKGEEDYKHKLWDQLYIMADFDLDINSPYPKPDESEIFAKPDRLSYRKELRNNRYYGRLIQNSIDEIKDWEEGDRKEAATLAIANQMKKNYVNWNKDNVDDRLILEDLKRLSDGKLSLPENTQLVQNIQKVEKNAGLKANRKRKKKSKN